MFNIAFKFDQQNQNIVIIKHSYKHILGCDPYFEKAFKIHYVLNKFVHRKSITDGNGFSGERCSL